MGTDLLSWAQNWIHARLMGGGSPGAHAFWAFGPSQWLSWGVAVMVAAGIGLHLRRWADAYAQRLDGGDEASAGTLLRAGLAVRHGWHPGDGWMALGLAVPAAVLLLAQGWAVLTWVIVGLILVILAWMDARSGLLPDAVVAD